MRALRWLTRAVRAAIALLVGALVAVTLAQVYFRYVTGGALAWSEELARYLFVWVVFLGSAVAVGQRAHIVVDVVVVRLPAGLQRGLALGAAVLVVAFVSFLAVYGGSLVRLAWAQTSPGLGVSRGFLFLAVPVGAALMCVYGLAGIGDLVRRRRPEEPDDPHGPADA